MKKIICFVASLAITASIFTGCAKKSNDTNVQNPAVSQNNGGQDQNSNSNNANTQVNGNHGNGRNQNREMPGLVGEISAINGNSVTLKLIEITNINRGDNGNQQGKQNGGQSQSSNSQNAPANGQTPPVNNQSTDASQSNGRPNRDANRGQNGGPNGGPMGGANMQVKYTGETKTITIPEGTIITTFNRGPQNSNSQNGNQTNLAIKDLKVGDRLNIYYSDSNQTAISKINVMNLNMNQQ